MLKKQFKKLISLFLIVLSAIIPFNLTAYAQNNSINPYNNSIPVCPILNYHGLTTDESQLSDWVITPQKFESDLKGLIEKGYTPIFTSDLLNHIKNGTELPEKPVIIQFDDGYSSVYELAFPILYKYNAKAEVYIITDYTKDVPFKHNTDTFLSWPQLKVMSDSGLMYIGLHGKNHEPIVSGISSERIKSNLQSAWSQIDSRISQQYHFYAYPNGLFNTNTIKAVTDAGADIQFIWVWNIANNIQQYNVMPRTTVTNSKTALEAIEYFNKTLKSKTH